MENTIKKGSEQIDHSQQSSNTQNDFKTIQDLMNQILASANEESDDDFPDLDVGELNDSQSGSYETVENDSNNSNQLINAKFLDNEIDELLQPLDELKIKEFNFDDYGKQEEENSLLSSQSHSEKVYCEDCQLKNLEKAPKIVQDSKINEDIQKTVDVNIQQILADQTLKVEQEKKEENLDANLSLLKNEIERKTTFKPIDKIDQAQSLEGNICGDIQVYDMPTIENTTHKNEDIHVKSNYEMNPDLKALLAEDVINLLNKNRCYPLDFLAEGGEGVVYSGIIINEDGREKEVVFKIITNSEKQSVFQELNIMKKLKESVGIIKLLQCIELKKGEIYLFVLEKCKYSLLTEMQQMVANQTDFSKTKLSKVLIHLLDGLIQLKIEEILHLDIKPGNILVTLEEDYIYSDFGISLVNNSMLNFIKGHTERYASKEQSESSNFTGFSSDVYSLGIAFQLVLKIYSDRNGNKEDEASIAQIKEIISQSMAQEDTTLRKEPKYLHQKILEKFIDSENHEFLEGYSTKIEQIVKAFKKMNNKEGYAIKVLYYLDTLLKISEVLNKDEERIKEIKEEINRVSLKIILQNHYIDVYNACCLKSLLAQHTTSIASLDIKLNYLEIDVEVNYLAQSLSNFVNLTSVKLSFRVNSIGESGTNILCKGLAKCSQLTILTLDLSKNNIGDTGASCLATLLSNFPELSSLTYILLENNISDVGVFDFDKAIRSCNSLKSLHLDLMKNDAINEGCSTLRQLQRLKFQKYYIQY